MKRISLLALLFTALLCSNAQADFLIDDFTILDDAGGPATSIGSDGITVAVTDSVSPTSMTVSDDQNDRYLFVANAIGDSFVVSYDFGGVFSDLQPSTGNLLTQAPADFLFGGWTLAIDTDVSEPVVLGSTTPTILPTSIALDNATELNFTFTYNGDSPIGVGIASFGGTSNPLFATPEPTAFMMLGTAGLIVLFPRRRRS